MKTPFDGLSGGSNYNNSNGKSKGKKKEAKEYFVYKYTKDVPLAEQIILGNKSVFLQIDNDRNPVISTKLDLSKNQNIVLLPQQDGINGVASYTLPIRFRDLKEIKDFIEAAQHQTIDSIFFQHKTLWEKFVVSYDEHTITFLAIDSVYSKFQDLFETTHCDLIDGAPGSGKGATLITFQLLGYRVVLAADISGANILDLYGSNGRCQITIAEDELDDIEDDAVKRKMYKVGYDLTGKAPRTLDGNTSNRTNRLYEIFGFKIFGTEIASDDKILGGFNDRNFRIENTKGKPEFRVKKVLSEMEKPLEKQSPKYSQIVSEVEYVRKLTFIFRMLHYDDMIEEVETNIDGRPLELTGPQIYLFASKELGSSYRVASTGDEKKNTLFMKEILPTLTEFLKRKGQLTEKTIQSVVSDALDRLISYEPNDERIHRSISEVTSGKIRKLIEIAYDRIYEEVMEITEGKDSTIPNEQAFYSAEYGKITHRQILKICKNPFRGEPSKMEGAKTDDTSKKRNRKKTMIFDKELLKKLAQAFKAIKEIRVLEDGDTNSEEEREAEAAGTEGRNFDRTENKRENKESDPTGQPDQSNKEDSNNHTNPEGETEESQDIPSDNANTTEAENGLGDAANNTDKKGVYSSTAPNSVPQSQSLATEHGSIPTEESKPENTQNNSVPQSPDSQEKQEQGEQPPPWQRERRGWTDEEAQAFKKEVARRSKLADMAEANEAGKGLFGDKEESKE